MDFDLRSWSLFPVRSEKLVAAVAESASALTLQEEESITAIPGTIPHITIDCSSSASPFNLDKFVAGTAESSSSQTLQERDVLSSSELHDDASVEETIIAGPQTVPHDTIDGSSSTSPSRFQKLVEGFVGTTQTSQEHCSYLEELLDAVLEGSMGARLRSVLQDTTCSSPTRASLRSSNLSRSPPNWYEVFYIRMDHEGSFYMYPDLGGPFPCIDEADIAIKRYLDELQSRARNNGSPGMKHPKSTDAYTGGHLDGYFPFDFVELSSSEDEEDQDTRLRHMFEGLDDPHVWDYLFPSSRSVEVEDINF
nr:unnamed protein product [Digitaria exilis]